MYFKEYFLNPKFKFLSYEKHKISLIQKLPITVIVDSKKSYQQKWELRDGSLTRISFRWLLR